MNRQPTTSETIFGPSLHSPNEHRPDDPANRFGDEHLRPNRLLPNRFGLVIPTAGLFLKKMFWPAVFGIIGLAMLQVDTAVSTWFQIDRCPRWLLKALSLSECFAHGLGVAVILVAIYLLDPVNRRCIPRLLMMSIGSGMFANAFKLVIARARPIQVQLDANILYSFTHWWPGTQAGSEYQSFPSAHMATAVGLALGLGWLYPRGRILFVALAIMAGAQRVAALDHFISDVVWGTAAALFVVAGCVKQGLLTGWFDFFEKQSALESGHLKLLHTTDQVIELRWKRALTLSDATGWPGKSAKPEIAGATESAHSDGHAFERSEAAAA